jgi:hypothetical protein
MPLGIEMSEADRLENTAHRIIKGEVTRGTLSIAISIWFWISMKQVLNTRMRLKPFGAPHA